MNDAELRAAARLIVVLRGLAPETRMNALAIACKVTVEPKLVARFFAATPERPADEVVP